MSFDELQDDGGTTGTGVVDTLVARQRQFIRFLEARVESRDAAEEILQASFGKALEKQGELADHDSAIPWFYRVLRNAVVDHYRRRDATDRPLDEAAQERESERRFDDELQGEVCACFEGLIPTLKQEHAEILRAVDLEQRALGSVAEDLGITANNAGVRLHRARRALRERLVQLCSTCAEHGCLNCTCDSSGGGRCAD